MKGHKIKLIQSKPTVVRKLVMMEKYRIMTKRILLIKAKASIKEIQKTSMNQELRREAEAEIEIIKKIIVKEEEVGAEKIKKAEIIEMMIENTSSTVIIKESIIVKVY